MNSGKKANEFTAVDLFSGCGGLSLGLKRAGFSVKAAVEIDPAAVHTYLKNHPDTTLIHSDIRKVKAKDLKRAAKLGNRRLDLLAGCPPCQGFSRIRRKGHYDPRNDLIFEFLRMVKNLQPRLVLMENVPGLADDARFQIFLKRIKSYGYFYEWGILDAADFGVPQRRKRLIVMASRSGTVSLPRPVSNHYKTVRDCIGKLENPKKTNDEMHKTYMRNGPRVMKIIAEIPRDGGSRRAMSKKFQLACHKRTQGFRDVYGRMKWDSVSPTLTGGCYNPSKGRFLHPKQNRPISLREAALLQTFPKKYSFPLEAGLTSIGRLIGDALPPVFAERQGKHLLQTLSHG